MDAVQVARSHGVDETVAVAVIAAYQRVAKVTGRAFDPATWSRTVWLAEADRFERAESPEAHYSLLLHLQRLREEYEEKYRRGARSWRQGQVGERLTKR